MKKWRLLLLCTILLPLAALAWGQSNSVVDQLLAQDKASYGNAAYMALSAAKQIPDTASLDDAMAALAATHWRQKLPGSDAPVTLGEYSYLLMKAFKMKGGLMYSLAPGPRYAARELAYLGLVNGDTSPYRILAGRDVVEIVGNVLNYLEAHQ